MFSWANFAAAVATSVTAAVLAVVGALFLARRKSAQEKDERVRALELQIAILTQQVSPLWTAAQAILIKQMTHYHAPEMDELMRKVGPPFTLSADEEHRLYVLLEERTRDVDGMIDSSERDAAAMLPLVIRRVREELNLKAQDTQILVVAVPRMEDR
jgi:hypothetical protein